jgi:hypothetical protein
VLVIETGVGESGVDVGRGIEPRQNVLDTPLSLGCLGCGRMKLNAVPHKSYAFLFQHPGHPPDCVRWSLTCLCPAQGGYGNARALRERDLIDAKRRATCSYLPSRNDRVHEHYAAP